MAMTLKEFKKSSFKNALYFNDIKSKKDLNDLRDEIIELTNNGNREAMYELAQMESFDIDDIRKLIQ